jgi:hypothetical protein
LWACSQQGAELAADIDAVLCIRPPAELLLLLLRCLQVTLAVLRTVC